MKKEKEIKSRERRKVGQGRDKREIIRIGKTTTTKRNHRPQVESGRRGL